uniref:Tetratricopeptide repeat protein n=1 Tax=Schlesneria paludicola TaxID=360056 RepID=A0A7C2JZ76_9PLAN
MLCLSPAWRRGLMGAACAAALAGCSNSRTHVAQSSSSPLPDRQSTLVPGAADRGDNQELRNPARIHVAFARWQEQQKQIPEARESYNKALTHDPKSVDALLGLSRLDQLAGRTAEAEQRLRRAEELQPNSGLTSAAWAEYYAAQGKWPEAIARYQQAIERSPEDSLYRHQFAIVLAKSGRTEDAIAAFTPLVGAAEAHYNVGYLLHQQGNKLAAEEQFQRALALKPDLSTASTMLARSRRDRGVLPAGQPEPAPVMTAAASVQPAVATTSATGPATAADNRVEPVAWRPYDGGRTSQSTVSSVPQPPAGLTPQQLEQWNNQRAAGR